MKISVLSDGAWGTVLALLLCGNGHKVKLWGPFPDYVREMAKKRENTRFLPGTHLGAELQLEENISEAVKGAELIVLAAPSQYLRETLIKLKDSFNANTQIIVNVAKGIENGSFKRMSELCFEILGQGISYVALSGPSHAEEVVRKCPTAVVVASSNLEKAKLVQSVFMNDYFRIYTSDDIGGVELGGALKNVLAIAAGVIDGMKLGDNPKAALITRGIAEMARLGIALGGRYETFSGLSGIGDLIVTCVSGFSRNRHVGEELGRGKKIDDIISAMGMVVAEGVKTTAGAYELARSNNVDTPIINEVYSVLYKGKDPRTALSDLMTRKARHEHDGICD
ncbi:MAG: glycerol-3-phosphate dehydrogenase [Lentisphaerae bacterium GWF2_44_16]|nr:MAG: glycerol-3-phosphate dehydrogenase [Lentisphaerae bacterium GWF2_44_16]